MGGEEDPLSPMFIGGSGLIIKYVRDLITYYIIHDKHPDRGASQVASYIKDDHKSKSTTYHAWSGVDQVS